MNSGKLRGLGTTRTPVLRNVPTIMESGLPEYELMSYLASATAKEIVATLNETINRALSSPDLPKKLFHHRSELAIHLLNERYSM